MADDKGRIEREAGGGKESGVADEPAWPQRPDRTRPEPARPRLDPPEPSQGRQGKETYRPAASRGVADETKETRLLPIVEPPRPGIGRPSSSPVTPPGAIPTIRRDASPPARETHRSPIPAPQPQPTDRRPEIPRHYEQYEREVEIQGYVEENRQGSVEPPDRNIPRSQVPSAQPRLVVAGRKEKEIAGGAGRNYLSAETGIAKERRGSWLLWALAGILSLSLIGALAFALAWQGQYAGKVYSGVTVLGEDLGGQTQDEAKERLQEKVKAFQAQPVLFAWRGKEWRPSAEQIGLKVDVDGTVNEAFGVGRASDMFGNVAQQWAAAQGGYAVPLTVQMNEPALQNYLDGIAREEINQELFEGDVRLNGTEIVSLPGKEGRALRTYDTINAVRELAAKIEPGKIDLPVEIIQPTVSAEEVGYIQGLLSVRISSPITATASGKVFTLDREAIVRFTTIERNPDRTASRHIDLGWNEVELKELGERWAKEATRPAQSARFAWNGGALSVLTESVDGFETTEGAVVSAIKENSGTSDRRQFELPGKVLTPTVSSKDLPALGIREAIGSGLSTFKGSSEERAKNIRVAADLLNGAVVPPGGTFSFLQTMGGIDESQGFVPSYVIAAERTQLGVGGGVCQVSTTAFRAAFWSGVEITERNQHSYRVGWYEANKEPVGFDAAVFDPGVDLKWVNNTQSHILVEAVIVPDSLTITMYGTKIPGEVKLEGPQISNRVPAPPDVYEVDARLDPGTKKQVETARGGLDTVITRRIIVPGQPDKVDEFYSSYKAWPNWFVVASPSQIP